MGVGAVAVISGAAQLLDIIIGLTSKHPESAPHFAPLVGNLIGVASRAAEETPEQTAKRLADHDALVASVASGPPPGAKLPTP